MGLEIPQEFYPITPVRTNPDSRTYNTGSPPSSAKSFKAAQDDQSERVRGAVEDDQAVVRSSGAEIVNGGATADQIKVSDAAVLVDDDECHTPTSEDQLLRTPLVCPPAPKKPRPEMKRKSPSRHHLCLGIPADVDLSSIFVFVDSNAPQSKKIKAG